MRSCTLKPVEGGRVVRIKMRSDYTETLRDDIDLGWEAMPEQALKMDLEGEVIGGQNFILTPGGGLKQEIDVQFVSASDFKVVRSEHKKKKGVFEDKLYFEITCNQADCTAWIDDYLRVVGDAIGVLKMNFSQTRKDADSATKDENQPSLIELPEEVKKGGARVKKAATEVTQ